MASADPILASVDLWPGNFAPEGWFYCAGQGLAISQYSALFSLLGTTYGGNGTTTFNLPDLRGRVAIGAGQAQSGTTYTLGEVSGSESITLLSSQVPLVQHTHNATTTDPVYSATATGTVTPGAGTGKVALTNDPTNNYPAQAPAGTTVYTSTKNAAMGSSALDITVNLAKTTAGSVAIAQAGQNANAPVSLMQPYLALNYIIAWQGIYPQRP